MKTHPQTMMKTIEVLENFLLELDDIASTTCKWDKQASFDVPIGFGSFEGHFVGKRTTY